MSTEIEVNNCFVIYDFSFKNETFATFTFAVKDMFSLQSETSRPKDFLASFRSIKIFLCSILHFQMYINSLDGVYKMLS